MTEQLKNRIKDLNDFLNTEKLTEREKNLLRSEIAFLQDLLDMCIVIKC